MSSDHDTRHPCPRCRVTTHHSNEGISLIIHGENVHAACATQNELINLPIWNLRLMPRWGLSDDTMGVLRGYVHEFLGADRRVQERKGDGDE